jgi:6-phosphofructokinase 1
VIREGWEGLVRGNSTSSSVSPTPNSPSLPIPIRIVDSKSQDEPQGNFAASVGEGEYLKEGESDARLKGRYIVKVGWHDVRGFLREVSD